MISFSDTLLLSSTILNSNEKETQTSNDLIEKKSLQTDISNEYFASLEESYTEINEKLYT